MPTVQSRVVAHGLRATQRRRKAAMAGRPDPVSVAAEFLRKALANAPVLVSELEAAARAAGLLGSDQSISEAKLFKRAKKSLCVRSVHSGFRSAGKWFWLLETPAPLVADPPPEVAPRIPSSWIEGVGRLTPQRPPPGVPMHLWRLFLTDCHRFLSAGCWAERAAAKGWDALALFGCGLHRPLVHRGAAGLLWAIVGGRLVELHRDWAVVELAENGSRRIFDRRRLETGNVRLPWIGA